MTSGYHNQLVSILFLETGSLIKPRFYHLASWSVSPSLVLSLRAWKYRHMPSRLAFYVGACPPPWKASDCLQGHLPTLKHIMKHIITHVWAFPPTPHTHREKEGFRLPAPRARGEVARLMQVLRHELSSPGQAASALNCWAMSSDKKWYFKGHIVNDSCVSRVHYKSFACLKMMYNIELWEYKEDRKLGTVGKQCGSVVEHLPQMGDALGSILSNRKNEKKLGTGGADFVVCQRCYLKTRVKIFHLSNQSVSFYKMKITTPVSQGALKP